MIAPTMMEMMRSAATMMTPTSDPTICVAAAVGATLQARPSRPQRPQQQRQRPQQTEPPLLLLLLLLFSSHDLLLLLLLRSACPAFKMRMAVCLHRSYLQHCVVAYSVVECVAYSVGCSRSGWISECFSEDVQHICR